MKQSSSTKLPEMADNGSVSMATELEIEEINEVLSLSTKDGPMKLTEKRKFLNSCLDHTPDIKEHSQLFDCDCSDSNLCQFFEENLPKDKKSTITRGNNKEVTDMLTILIKPLLLLNNYIKEQKRRETQSKAHLRTSTLAQNQTLLPFFTLLKNIELLYTKIEEIALQRRSASQVNGINAVKLTPIQKERKFDVSRVPEMEYMKRCPICKHESINFPLENDAILQSNSEKEKEYQDKLNKWEEYTRKKSKDSNTKKPKGINIRPRRLVPKQPIIQCMCSQSFCLANCDASTVTCPIKCKKDNGEKYGYNAQSRMCECPVCKCKCSFACHIGDVRKIMLSKVQFPKESANVHSAETNGRTTNILGNVFKQAFEVGFNSLHDNLKRETSTSPQKYLSPSRIENIKDHSMSIMCSKAAIDLGTTSPNISFSEKKKWQELFGRPTTMCELPTGDLFDTKTIPTAGKHGYNNKLQHNHSSPAKFQKGMKTAIEIDCDDITSQSFSTYISRGNMMNATEEATRSSKNVSVETATQCKEQLSTNEDILDVYDSVDVARKKEANLAVKGMYGKLVAHCRAGLKDSIVAMKSKNAGFSESGDTEMFKVEAQKCNDRLNYLESMRNKIVHYQCIRNVTNAGMDILDELECDEEEILDRLDIYVDMNKITILS